MCAYGVTSLPAHQTDHQRFSQTWGPAKLYLLTFGIAISDGLAQGTFQKLSVSPILVTRRAASVERELPIVVLWDWMVCHSSGSSHHAHQISLSLNGFPATSSHRAYAVALRNMSKRRLDCCTSHARKCSGTAPDWVCSSTARLSRADARTTLHLQSSREPVFLTSTRDTE